MASLTKARFLELYQITDEIFQGDRQRAARMALQLKDEKARRFFIYQYSADCFMAMKAVFGAYAKCGRDYNWAWETLYGSFNLNAS